MGNPSRDRNLGSWLFLQSRPEATPPIPNPDPPHPPPHPLPDPPIPPVPPRPPTPFSL
jgi:hypothetical protein